MQKSILTQLTTITQHNTRGQTLRALSAEHKGTDPSCTGHPETTSIKLPLKDLCLKILLTSKTLYHKIVIKIKNITKYKFIYTDSSIEANNIQAFVSF